MGIDVRGFIFVGGVFVFDAVTGGAAAFLAGGSLSRNTDGRGDRRRGIDAVRGGIWIVSYCVCAVSRDGAVTLDIDGGNWVAEYFLWRVLRDSGAKFEAIRCL